MLSPIAVLCFAPSTLAVLPSPQDTLESHALYQRLDLNEVSGHRRVRLLIEAPRRSDPNHVSEVTERFRPWLDALATSIEANYGLPNRLESQARDSRPLVVLSSQGTYKNAQRYDPRPSDDYKSAVLVDPPGVITTWWDKSLLRAPAHEVRRPAMRILARILLEEYMPEGGPLEPWLQAGIPGYLTSQGPEATPADMARPAPSESALARLREVMADPQRREGYLIPLEQLADCPDAGAAAELGKQAAHRAGLPLRPHTYDPLGSHVFVEQASLWIHFLHQGRASRYNKTFQNYVAKALHRNGGSAALARLLGVDTLSELDTSFLAHMDMLLGGGVIALPEVNLAPRAKLIHPGVLPPAKGLAAQRISALGRAVSGDLEGAIMELEKASLETSDASARKILLTEQSRLISARDLRSKFLASLIGSSRKLRLARDGESVSVNVKGLAQDTLYFKPNKAGLEQLGIPEVTPADLVRSLGTKAREHGPAWAGAFLALLAQDPRWNRQLKGDEADELNSALDGGLRERIEAAHLHAQLFELACTPAPTAPFEAEAILESLGKAIAGPLTSPLSTQLLADARGGLRELATDCLQQIFDHKGIEGLVQVPVRALGNGAVRLTYDFDSPTETLDFTTVGQYLSDRTAKLFKLQGAASEGEFKVAGGEWRGVGHAVFRHILPLQPPIKVRYEVVYGRPRPGKGMAATLLMGMCDDGEGNYVGAWDMYDLEAIDLPSGQTNQAYHEGARTLKSAQAYSLELRHDGESASLHVQGKEQQRVAAGARNSGNVLLLVHSEITVAVRRIEIEGRVASDDLKKARTSWVEARLSELGL